LLKSSVEKGKKVPAFFESKTASDCISYLNQHKPSTNSKSINMKTNETMQDMPTAAIEAPLTTEPSRQMSKFLMSPLYPLAVVAVLLAIILLTLKISTLVSALFV
jgi:hypothetical protein